MLVRLPPELASRLRQLARSTRIRQSDYLREAVSDLLAKYGHLSSQDTDGAAIP
ncbi:MAG TPA: ribbon-helix-helix domain-containing protein [Anaeromyxobacteraceae bacterium]|nr:ribbon-helix-helix domain-containing protein [Anaeromyxobacteraceae bacterium]